MRLGLRPPMLMPMRLELSHRGGSVIVRIVDKGVDGNGSIGRVDAPPLVAGGSLILLDFLYVGRPNISSCPASLDSDHDEGDDISKNYKVSKSTQPARTSLLQSLRSIVSRKQITAIPWTGIETTAGC